MTSFQILPPEKFDFAQPEQWQKMALLIRKIQTSVSLTSKSKEFQVNMLIYSMGEEADGIPYSFGLSNDNRKNTTQYQTSSRLTLLSEEPYLQMKKFNICVDRKKENL